MTTYQKLQEIFRLNAEARFLGEMYAYLYRSVQDNITDGELEDSYLTKTQMKWIRDIYARIEK